MGQCQKDHIRLLGQGFQILRLTVICDQIFVARVHFAVGLSRIAFGRQVDDLGSRVAV